MNLANLEKRLEVLKSRVSKLRPAENPPLLVIEFVDAVNVLAPEGTTAHVPGIPKGPDRLVLIPPGYRSEEQ